MLRRESLGVVRHPNETASLIQPKNSSFRESRKRFRVSLEL